MIDFYIINEFDGKRTIIRDIVNRYKKKATSVGTLVVDGNRMILDSKLITELLKYVEQCLDASFRELAASVRGRYD